MARLALFNVLQGRKFWTRSDRRGTISVMTEAEREARKRWYEDKLIAVLYAANRCADLGFRDVWINHAAALAEKREAYR